MGKRILSVLGILGLLWLMSGCAVNRTSASLTPGSDLSGFKHYYVVSQPNDKNGVDRLIKERLNKMGFAASVGPELALPYKADAVVTYNDKWMWDITMYMIELTITVRNPTNNFPLATGNSYHTSLTRKSPEGMVDEVLTNIFAAPKK